MEHEVIETLSLTELRHVARREHDQEPHVLEDAIVLQGVSDRHGQIGSIQRLEHDRERTELVCLLWVAGRLWTHAARRIQAFDLELETCARCDAPQAFAMLLVTTDD
jgi:hypothetical protein